MVFAAPFQWTDPRSWPWFIYLWLAFVAAGLLQPVWKWFRRNRGKNWPTVAGRINWTEVRTKNLALTPSWKSNAGLFAVELGYAYAVEGQSYSGTVLRDQGTMQEARDFIRDLDGKVVMVSYNPRKPTISTLTDSAIADMVLQRAPAPEAALTPTPERDTPAWLRTLLWPLIALAVIGFVVSLWVHLGALAGKTVVPESFLWILHVGIFVVWFPAVLVSTMRAGSTQRRNFWKVVLRGSPAWLRYGLYGITGYETINFLVFFSHSFGQGQPDHGDTGWRMLSGIWLVFYYAAFAILYSAATAERSSLDPPRPPQS
jgi:hypothetical protein